MSTFDHYFADYTLKVIASVAGVLAIFQLFEVRRKRLIDMYWKIADIYASEEQRNARIDVWSLKTEYLEKNKNEVNHDDLVQRYNKNYHNTANKSKKGLDKSIVNRIRFLNQVGILLSKRLIDKDMLFGLIGIGLEIDYETLTFVLEAHRVEHSTPFMYSYFETTWHHYKKWSQNVK